MKLFDSLFGKQGQLRRSRRRSVRRWRKRGKALWNMNQDPGPGCKVPEKRRVRLLLLTGAALEILWMAGSMMGRGISIEHVAQVQLIGEGTRPETVLLESGRADDASKGIASAVGKDGEACASIPSQTEKTGVSIRMDDGTISIFRVKEHLERGGD